MHIPNHHPAGEPNRAKVDLLSNNKPQPSVFDFEESQGLLLSTTTNTEAEYVCLAESYYFNEKEEQDTKRRKSQMVGQLWNVSTGHLPLWSKMLRFKDIFERTCFLHVHPAVTNELNWATYFEVEDENSPLCLNISVAMLLGRVPFSERFQLANSFIFLLTKGAQALGEKEAEKEFWGRARRQLGNLFDVPDMNIASALYRLGDYAVQNGMVEQGTTCYFFFFFFFFFCWLGLFLLFFVAFVFFPFVVIVPVFPFLFYPRIYLFLFRAVLCDFRDGNL